MASSNKAKKALLAYIADLMDKKQLDSVEFDGIKVVKSRHLLPEIKKQVKMSPEEQQKLDDALLFHSSL